MAMKRVVKRTIGQSQLAELNSSLLRKVGKAVNAEQTSVVAAQAKGPAAVQMERVTPNEVTVQWKHNPRKVGLVESKCRCWLRAIPLAGITVMGACKLGVPPACFYYLDGNIIVGAMFADCR